MVARRGVGAVSDIGAPHGRFVHGVLHYRQPALAVKLADGRLQIGKMIREAGLEQISVIADQPFRIAVFGQQRHYLAANRLDL